MPKQENQEQQDSSNIIYRVAIVPDSYAGKRLDQALCQLFCDYSRSQLQKWLQQGNILVDGSQKQAKNKVVGGENICLDVALENHTIWQAEAMPLEVVYEDHDIIVINKPDNLVVHPGAGNPSGTLSNALLAYDKAFHTVPRAGIVHRLDKDTSGLMVAAKTLSAHTSLVKQLSQHQVTREYEAIVTGCIHDDRTIKTNIGRNPHNRLKMAVTPVGKTAITHIKILAHYRAHTRIRCALETGRTHQIRVHMQYINAPLLGDPVYNSRYKISKAFSAELQHTLKHFKRQALHAYKLAFSHPITLKPIAFRKKPPHDMQALIQVLEQDAKR